MSYPPLPIELIWAATHPSEDVNRTSPLLALGCAITLTL